MLGHDPGFTLHSKKRSFSAHCTWRTGGPVIASVPVTVPFFGLSHSRGWSVGAGSIDHVVPSPATPGALGARVVQHGILLCSFLQRPCYSQEAETGHHIGPIITNHLQYLCWLATWHFFFPSVPYMTMWYLNKHLKAYTLTWLDKELPYNLYKDIIFIYYA